MERTMNKPNLGEGSIGKLLLKMAVPAMLAQVVNLLYNIVDRVYIGHIAEHGDLALTGLGLCFPILSLVMAFAMLVGSGGAPRAAISMGSGDNESAEKILGNCFSLVILLSLVLTVTLELFARPLLMLFGASEATIPYALSYAQIYIAGSVFVMISLGLNMFITSQGFALISMGTVLIGAFMNIVLDPIFIFAFNMGVQGAALATIISQAVSAAWVLHFLFGKKTVLHIRRTHLKISKAVVFPVLALGLSPFIMVSTESLLNISFNSSLSRYGGDMAVGAMTILSSMTQMVQMPLQGLSQGAQPIMSYNYGAGKPERVRKTYLFLFVICLVYGLGFWAMIQLFPRTFVMIFNNNSPELINTTVWALRIYMAVLGFFSAQVVVQQTFVALGQAKLSLFIASLRKLILLIPLIFILPHFFADKTFAVFLAEPISDFISVATAVILFVLNIKKILANPPKKAAE